MLLRKEIGLGLTSLIHVKLVRQGEEVADEVGKCGLVSVGCSYCGILSER